MGDFCGLDLEVIIFIFVYFFGVRVELCIVYLIRREIGKCSFVVFREKVKLCDD